MQENIDDIIKEMRQIRPDCDDCISNHVCGYLSRFADRLDAAYKRDNLIHADKMARKMARKMEKEYEYAEKFKEGIVSCLHREAPCDKSEMYFGSVVVRREVGEWREYVDS